MEDPNKKRTPLEKLATTDQEALTQKALGNDDVQPNNVVEDDNDYLSGPLTTGTGSNLSSAAPNSLIVHSDKKGEDRYEVPKSDESEKHD